MDSIQQAVIVVDDDDGVRESLGCLLGSVGFKVIAFASGEDFLTATLPSNVCCLISDVRMPGRSGLELQDHLVRTGVNLPVIFMTGFGDVPLTVRAMKAGAT